MVWKHEERGEGQKGSLERNLPYREEGIASYVSESMDVSGGNDVI